MAEQETKITSLAERLRDATFEVFRGLRSYTQEYEANFPIIQRTNISLANIVAGQSINTENLAVLVQDLTTILNNSRALSKRAEEAVTEANIAIMKLKEVEDEPKNITEASLTQAQDS